MAWTGPFWAQIRGLFQKRGEGRQGAQNSFPRQGQTLQGIARPSSAQPALCPVPRPWLLADPSPSHNVLPASPASVVPRPLTKAPVARSGACHWAGPSPHLVGLGRLSTLTPSRPPRATHTCSKGDKSGGKRTEEARLVGDRGQRATVHPAKAYRMPPRCRNWGPNSGRGCRAGRPVCGREGGW